MVPCERLQDSSAEQGSGDRLASEARKPIPLRTVLGRLDIPDVVIEAVLGCV